MTEKLLTTQRTIKVACVMIFVFAVVMALMGCASTPTLPECPEIRTPDHVTEYGTRRAEPLPTPLPPDLGSIKAADESDPAACADAIMETLEAYKRSDAECRQIIADHNAKAARPPPLP